MSLEYSGRDFTIGCDGGLHLGFYTHSVSDVTNDIQFDDSGTDWRFDFNLSPLAERWRASGLPAVFGVNLWKYVEGRSPQLQLAGLDVMLGRSHRHQALNATVESTTTMLRIPAWLILLGSVAAGWWLWRDWRRRSDRRPTFEVVTEVSPVETSQ